MSLPCLQVLPWKFQPGGMSPVLINAACGSSLCQAWRGYSKEGEEACSGAPISVDGCTLARPLLVSSLCLPSCPHRQRPQHPCSHLQYQAQDHSIARLRGRACLALLSVHPVLTYLPVS